MAHSPRLHTHHALAALTDTAPMARCAHDKPRTSHALSALIQTTCIALALLSKVAQHARMHACTHCSHTEAFSTRCPARLLPCPLKARRGARGRPRLWLLHFRTYVPDHCPDSPMVLCCLSSSAAQHHRLSHGRRPDSACGVPWQSRGRNGSASGRGCSSHGCGTCDAALASAPQPT